MIASNSFHPLVYDTTLANATIGEPQESCEVGGVGVSNTVWYSFTPCGNGAANINTNGSGYDTVLSVFRGTCAAPTQIACDDDSGTGANSQLTGVPMSAGVAYLIKVADYGGPNGGCLVFNFDFTPAPPPNDGCANATSVGEGSFPFGTCATNTDGAGACGMTNDIWFLYGPTCTGSITASTCSPELTYNSVLAVYSGLACTGPLIACNDNGPAPCGLGSSVSFSAVAGQAYRIRVGGVAGAMGSGMLTISCPSNCSPDFNHDGDVGTDADIEDFFRCLAGSCCATCDSSDFNGDGDVGTDADIEAFFRVLAGGTC